MYRTLVPVQYVTWAGHVRTGHNLFVINSICPYIHWKCGFLTASAYIGTWR